MWRPTKGTADGTAKRYVNSLERWIELGLYSEDKLRQWLDVDIAELELDEYRGAIVNGWGISPSFIKKGLSKEATKEIYDLIVEYHPLMHPKMLSGIEQFAKPDDAEAAAVMLWFNSKGKLGVMPEVLYPEIIRVPEGPSAA